MNQIKSRLITNAKNILEHVERIQQSVGKVPQIDIDVLLSSIREMYEVALSADKANAVIDAYNAVSEENVSQQAVDMVEEQVESFEEKTVEVVKPTLSVFEAVAAMVGEKKVEEKTVVFESEIKHEQEQKVEEPIQPINTKEQVVEVANVETIHEIQAEKQTVEIGEDVSNNDLLSASTIIKFEAIEDKQVEQEPVVEYVEKEEVVEQQIPVENIEETIVEEKVEEKEVVVLKDEVVEVVEETVQVEETPIEEDKNNIVEEVEKIEVEPKVEPKKEEVEKHEEKPRQTSLFDYLKSSNVSKAAGQVDRFSTAGVKTLADKFQEAQSKKTVMSEDTEVSKQRIKDLRNVIGISDKFLFMNELFAGNMKAYNDFILYLTKIEETEEALNYLAEVEARYNWNKESLAVQTFMKIFERKFK